MASFALRDGLDVDRVGVGSPVFSIAQGSSEEDCSVGEGDLSEAGAAVFGSKPSEAMSSTKEGREAIGVRY